MTDDDFRKKLESKLEELSAAWDELDGSDDGDALGFDEEKEKRHLPPVEAFLYFAGASADTAEDLADALKKYVVDKLRLEGDDDLGTSMERIEDLTSEWRGGAADNFADYKDDLTNALAFQFEFAEALRAMVQLQKSLIEAVRESVLEVCDQGIAAYLQATADRDKAARQALGSVASAAFGTISGGMAGGGPHGAAAGAVAGFGAAVGTFVASINSSSSPEIGAQITKSLVTLYESTKEDQKTYREGLKKLAEHFEGELKERMLPMSPK